MALRPDTEEESTADMVMTIFLKKFRDLDGSGTGVLQIRAYGI